MTSIMVDLETLNTVADSQILTIGAVAFDSVGKITNEFYERIDIESCKELGLTEHVDTVTFWKNQDKDVYNEAFNSENRISIKDAMVKFSEFFINNNGKDLWCNGANFDEPILSLVFRRLNMTPPWKFWNVRCVRTLLHLSGKTMKDFGNNTHNALDDCKNQVKAVIICKEWIKGAYFWECYH